MTNLQNVELIASSRGRVRIAIPDLYRSPARKTEFETRLARYKGVLAVYANPLTARVLILFDPALRLDLLLAGLGLDAGKPGRVQAASAGRQPDPPAGPGLAKTRHAVQPVPPPHQRHPPYAAWHLREAGAALAFFGSSRASGLSPDEAAQRLRHGQNLLSRHKPVSSLEILLNQFKSLPIVLLAVSAAVSLLTGGVLEAAAIGAVLVLNGGLGFVTERRAESTIASLAELIDDIVPVLRGGQVRQVDSAQIVGGDVLALAPGTRIAADARLLEANGLSVDESALTGESLPVHKDSAALSGNPPLAERHNMVYRGTAVSMGSGLGLVVGTGNKTEVGTIQALTGMTRRPRTRIQTQLDQLGNQLVILSGAACLGVFALGLLRGYPRLAMFKTAISLAIAAVPEGLPTVATTSLARGIGRMREHNVLIRRLHAVETIGTIQTICLDKTGTLTMNRMSAVEVRTALRATAADAADADAALAGGAGAELQRLLQICVLCSEAGVDGGQGDSPGNGSATENALLELAARYGVQAAAMRQRFTLLGMELRAEGRNTMRTVHAMPDSPLCLNAVKGSPEQVLALCSHYLADGRALELDEEARDHILRQNVDMAEKQLRVLGFAYAETPPPAAVAASAVPALTWTGLVGLADPLRPGMADLIASFHRAGIRTVMLTGDQAATAHGIGKALDLGDGEPLHIIENIETIAPRDLSELARKAHVFSRVSPAHKLQIVRALQEGGRIIAMTGDGINDGPALRAADIGIAMGGGTDLALSVADVALKDDQLAALLEAVRQGRAISNNIRKSLHFLLSSNLSEILVVFGSIAAGAGQPLTPLQLLWLNLLSDLLPATALAAEPADEGLMSLPPRDPQRPLVEREELWRYAREGGRLAGGTLGVYLYGLLRHGGIAAGAAHSSPGQANGHRRAGTLAFNSLVLGQLLHALSCRSDQHRALFDPRARPNRQLALAIGASAGLQLLANLLPGLRRLLGIAPLGPADIAVTLAGALVPLILNERAKKAYAAPQH